MDMEVIWTPLAFHGRLAALTMATDVTARRQTAHHNAVFGQVKPPFERGHTGVRGGDVHLRGGG